MKRFLAGLLSLALVVFPATSMAQIRITIDDFDVILDNGQTLQDAVNNGFDVQVRAVSFLTDDPGDTFRVNTLRRNTSTIATAIAADHIGLGSIGGTDATQQLTLKTPGGLFHQLLDRRDINVGTAPAPPTDCDEASEIGRLYYDTDAAAGDAWWGCTTGSPANWEDLVTGGGGAAAGANGDIQLSDGASGFKADSAFNYNDATNVLNLGTLSTLRFSDATDPDFDWVGDWAGADDLLKLRYGAGPDDLIAFTDSWDGNAFPTLRFGEADGIPYEGGQIVWEEGGANDSHLWMDTSGIFRWQINREMYFYKLADTLTASLAAMGIVSAGSPSTPTFSIAYGLANGLSVTSVQGAIPSVGGDIHMQRARGDLTAASQIVAGDTIGSYFFNAWNDNVSGSYENAAAITVITETGAVTQNNDMPARIEFATSSDNSATPTTRLSLFEDLTLSNGTGIIGNSTSLVDLSAADASATTEGLKLPQHATACATGFGEGHVCWDADTDDLYIGTGAAFKRIADLGTLTDTQFCVWDAAGNEIDCNNAGGGGGDSITLNDAAFTATDADFDDDLPAAPANSVNVKWQGSGSGPSNISANIPLNNTADGAGLAINLSGLEPTATGELALLQGCADGDVLQWIESTSQWDCDPDNDSGGSPTWNSITDPSATQSLAMGVNTTLFTWDSGPAEAAINAFTLAWTHDSTSGAAAQHLLTLRRNEAAGTEPMESLLRLQNLETTLAVDDGLLIEATAGGNITTGIDFEGANFTNIIQTDISNLTSNDLELLDDGLISFITPAEIADECAGLESVRRNTGDTAWECFTPAAATNNFGTIGSAVADTASDTLTVNDSATIDFTTSDVGDTFTADFLPAGVGSATWLDNADRTWTFDIAAAGTNPTMAFAASSVLVDAVVTIDDGQELRLREPGGFGTEYVGFRAPAGGSPANSICELNSSSVDLIPDTCIGGILEDEQINLSGAEVTGVLPAASVGNGLTNVQVNDNIDIDHTGTGTLTLDQTINPTTEAVIAWSVADEELHVGNGGGTETFVPTGTQNDEQFCSYETTGNQIDCDTATTGTGNLVRADTPTFTTDIVFPAGSIEAGAYGANTIDAGDVAASLDTRTTRFVLADPDPAAVNYVIPLPAFTGTMTEIRCQTYGASCTNVVIDICDGEDFADDTCTTSIPGANMTCTDTGAWVIDSTLSATGFVAYDEVSLVIVSESGTCDRLAVVITHTVD